MSKIWAIAWRDLYITFTDRNAVLIMIVTPLALAAIIGYAFSGFFNTGGDVPVRDISLAVVNLDGGSANNGVDINNGQIFVDALVPLADATAETLEENVLYTLTNAVELEDADAARAGVDDGTYAAAIIVPPDFSQNLTYSQTSAMQPTAVEVYASAANPVSASIVRSVAASIGSQIAAGNITIAATIETLIERAQSDRAFGIRFGLAATAGTFNPDFAAAFDPSSNPLAVEQQTVSGEAPSFNPLVLFGAGQAVFFMMFTAMAGANSLLEERRDWTLQRLIASPTPRIVILLGKLIGTFITCLAQVTLLFLALTVIGSLISGQAQFIWGTNIPAILATLVAVALAASGLGALVAAVVKTPEQGNLIGSVISLMMGLFGGAFFDISQTALSPLSRLTINYWGVDAFTRLALNQTDIGVNLIVLLGMGAVLFFAGLFIFDRRLNV